MSERPTSAATVIDDFERSDLAHYTGFTGEATIVEDTGAVSNTRVCRHHTHGNGKYPLVSREGLDVYPEPGTTFEYHFYVNDGGNVFVCGFASQGDGFSQTNQRCPDAGGYAVEVRNGQSVQFRKDERIERQQDLGSLSNGWHRVEVGWDVDGQGTMRATLYDPGGATVQSVEYTDTEYRGGGIHFGQDNHNGYSNTTYFDAFAVTDGSDRTEIIDDFEDGDLSEYDYTAYGTDLRTDRTYEGEYALELPSRGGSTADSQCVSVSGDLPYPSRGDTFGGYLYQPDETNQFRFVFAAQSASKDPDGYNVAVSGGRDFLIEVDRRGTELARTSLSDVDHTDKWLKLVIDWDYDESTDTTTITATLYDKGPDGTEDNGVLAQIQGSESPSTYESGGLAFNGDARGASMAFDQAQFFGRQSSGVSATVSTLSFIPGGNENSTEGGDPLFSSVSEILLQEHTFEFEVDEEIDLGLLGEIDISWDVLKVRAPPLFDAWGVGDMIEQRPDGDLDEATSPLPDKYSDEFPGEAHDQFRVFNDVNVAFDTDGNGAIDRDSVTISFDGERSMTAIEGEEINRLDAERIGAKERNGNYYFEGGDLPRFERSRIVGLDGTEAVQVSTIFGGYTAVAKHLIDELPNYDSTLVFLNEVLGWKFEVGGEEVADIIQEIPEPIRSLVTTELNPVIALLAATPNIFTFVEFTVLPDGRRFVRLWDSSMFPKHALYMDERQFDMTQLPYEKKERLNPRFAFFLGEAATRAVTPYHAPNLLYAAHVLSGLGPLISDTVDEYTDWVPGVHPDDFPEYDDVVPHVAGEPVLEFGSTGEWPEGDPIPDAEIEAVLPDLPFFPFEL
ncbi:hypothetical protein BRC81_07145 [Halobacteriales archaeon QS_1_68_20]|nr:MAG: hypothetical protein BRC81_07145 [Halobacteriales archaeon QS_1_68_20]